MKKNSEVRIYGFRQINQGLNKVDKICRMKGSKRGELGAARENINELGF